MLFSIPILVEEQSGGAGRSSWFAVRPLFHPAPVQRAAKLSRALAKLTHDLQELLNELGRAPRPDPLANWMFHPSLETTTLDLRLELQSGSYKGRFFFAGYPALGRKIYFTPSVPEVWFERLAGQSLAERAAAVLTAHFRDQEKDDAFYWDPMKPGSRARLTTLELESDPAALATSPKKSQRERIFGGADTPDGESELRKTGRPLHLAYPDDLERAVDREGEVAELARLLAGGDRRSIVLVGRRKTGKSAVIHELVWRLCARKKEGYGGGREVWLVSPSRLISGMSCLGEWETRAVAIFDHAQAKDKVLYFDDLPGLFAAGVSSASDLNVAQVLKPVLEKRLVRVLAEITPESWRVLRERDRAFADLFQVIPVGEMSETETLHVLVSVARQLEEDHHCAFSLAVAPLVFDLFRRFGGDAAFPGKAAGFLRRLAVRSAGRAVDETTVLGEFQAQTGLHPAFLSGQPEMSRTTILEALRKQVQGQDHALDAFADVLVKLKAQLNDPRRPLGTFLLLGPTGVGKTQAAKALAQFLFGHEDRLVRFDMNECVDAAAAARLTGTPSQPEGLLASAVRRQPFCVLLFDEIEKAAPEVFDVLLAVLDEGRLTDALGRVADFTHAIIILTSNLGAREARSRLGFRQVAPAEQAAVFAGAAEKFFRPEFFNRLDCVIPFHPLAPDHLAAIARRLLGAVSSREGVRRRDCLLQVLPAALDRLVELGYHPQLGARALKRVLEREVVLPLARRLAAQPPGTPMLVTFDAVEARFVLQAEPVCTVAPTVTWVEELAKPCPKETHRQWVAELLADVERFLERIATELEKSAPTGRIGAGQLSPEQAHYALCREQWLKVASLAKAAGHSVEPLPPGATLASLPKARPANVIIRQRSWKPTPQFDRRRAAQALRVDLEELGAEAAAPTSAPPVPALLREAAWLEALMASPGDDRPVGLVFRALSDLDRNELRSLVWLYRSGLASLFGTADPDDDRVSDESLPPWITQALPTHTEAVWCQGRNLRRVLPAEPSCVLVRREDGTLGGIRVSPQPAETVETLRALLANEAAQHGADPLGREPLGPAIHLVKSSENLTDFRTGLVLGPSPSHEEARAFLLSALPLPGELSF